MKVACIPIYQINLTNGLELINFKDIYDKYTIRFLELNDVSKSGFKAIKTLLYVVDNKKLLSVNTNGCNTFDLSLCNLIYESNNIDVLLDHITYQYKEIENKYHISLGSFKHIGVAYDSLNDNDNIAFVFIADIKTRNKRFKKRYDEYNLYTLIEKYGTFDKYSQMYIDSEVSKHIKKNN